MVCDPRDAVALRWGAVLVVLMTLWAAVTVIDLAWLHFTNEGARAREAGDV